MTPYVGDAMTTQDGQAPETGVALWRSIGRALQHDIAGGQLAPGARLPTESQLAARFAVNRHTIRRALEELSRAGLIRIEQGRGSFVTEDVMDYAIASRTRFSEWIRRNNKEPSGRILQLRELPCDADIAAGLAIAEGATVVLMERLGLADGKPISLAHHWFSAARFPGLLAELQRSAGISDALAACGLADYRRLTTRVSARLPTAEEAGLLNMPRNRPLLTTENINVDAADAVVEFATNRYPTPRVQIVFQP